MKDEATSGNAIWVPNLFYRVGMEPAQVYADQRPHWLQPRPVPRKPPNNPYREPNYGGKSNTGPMFCRIRFHAMGPLWHNRLWRVSAPPKWTPSF